MTSTRTQPLTTDDIADALPLPPSREKPLTACPSAIPTSPRWKLSTA